MFEFLGRSTYEQDAFKLRPLMPHGGGVGTSGVTEFIQPLKVYDQTNTQWIWDLSSGAMVDMVGTVVAIGFATFKVPAGYSGSITFSPVFHMGGATGDVVITHHGYYAAVGESNVAHVFNFNGGSQYTYTPGSTTMKKEFPAGFGASGGEYVQLYFYRVGTAAADTSGNALRFWGWDVAYA